MRILENVKRSVLFVIVAIFLVGCNTGEDGSAKAEDEDGVRKVKIAYVQSGKPMTYTDENGEAKGYDVEVLKAVEERLPQYEFEFVGTSDDDLLIGVEQGKYQVGVKNAFWSEERTEKFIYPKEFIGLSSTGLVVKKENASIKNLQDLASANFSLAPIAANNGQYAVVAEYNEKNPDNQVDLNASDTFSVDVVQWVNEGRVDGAIIIEGKYNRQVTDKDGPYHHLKDDVVYNEFAVIQTWPLFNKKEQQFADDFDAALKQVKEEGIPNRLSEKHYGRDLFELLDDAQK